MSVTYGFYNSVNHDRKYDAEQISRIFDGIITDGVYHSVGEAFSVTAGTDMSVNVASGRAWFNHTWTYNDAIIVLPITAAHSVYKRIDAVIVRIDTTNRTNSICVKDGTPASDPVKPTMESTSVLYEYPLAYVTVEPGATAVKSSGIEFVVGTSECPFVAGVQNGVNIDALVKNWTNEFDLLFTKLEDQISQAVSGTLIDGSVTYQKLAPSAVKYDFVNVEVDKDNVVENETYAEYGYCYSVDISLAGVDATMIPEVIFDLATLDSIGVAPTAKTFGEPNMYNGGVTIFLSDKLDANITIQSIMCWRTSTSEVNAAVIDGDEVAYG